MENLENFFQYSSVEFDIVRHFLIFGAAAMAVGLLYFLTTSDNNAPEYRVSSTISGVVMISAFITLMGQYIMWETSFDYDGTQWVGSNSTFSNGFRYINWSIDVPMLLTQLLIVLGFRGQQFRSLWIKCTVGGLCMIWLGYVGQFYESSNITNLYIWGAASTVFMVYVLYVIGNTLFITWAKMAGDVPPRAKVLLRSVFWLILISWTLYPIAYLLPHWWPTSTGMVVRQATFTIADITSKVIYGVMLSQITQLRSAQEGWTQAQRSPVV